MNAFRAVCTRSAAIAVGAVLALTGCSVGATTAGSGTVSSTPSPSASSSALSSAAPSPALSSAAPSPAPASSSASTVSSAGSSVPVSTGAPASASNGPASSSSTAIAVPSVSVPSVTVPPVTVPSVTNPSVTVPSVTNPSVTDGTTAKSSTLPSSAGATLPKGFPLPAGATVTAVVKDGDKELDGRLTLQDQATAFEFWKKALPAAGFPVTEAEMVGGLGEIDFTGGSCRSGSQIAVQQSSALVQCVLR